MDITGDFDSPDRGSIPFSPVFLIPFVLSIMYIGIILYAIRDINNQQRK